MSGYKYLFYIKIDKLNKMYLSRKYEKYFIKINFLSKKPC